MDWEKAKYLVGGLVTYWRAIGKPEWVDTLEQCLAKAERCQTMQDVVLDLRQRLERAEQGTNTPQVKRRGESKYHCS